MAEERAGGCEVAGSMPDGAQCSFGCGADVVPGRRTHHRLAQRLSGLVHGHAAAAGSKQAQEAYLCVQLHQRSQCHELLSSVLDAVEASLRGGEEAASTKAGTDRYALAKDYFDEAIFTTNITFEGGGWSSELTSKLLDDAELVNLTVQKQLAETWKQLVPGSSTEVRITPSIQALHNHVVELAQKQQGQVGASSASSPDRCIWWAASWRTSNTAVVSTIDSSPLCGPDPHKHRRNLDRGM